MPIYEFYCRDCHVLLNFFSARIAPAAAPTCPRCGRQDLPRRPSSFAMLRSGHDPDEADPLAGVDEARLEGALQEILRESDGVNENDPNAVGRLMKRFSQLSGLELGEQMEDYVSRLERGEDPEALGASLEEGMSKADDASELFRLKEAAQRLKKPRTDEEIYFL